MSFGNFGAKPRSMKNPVYWVSRFRQEDARRHQQDAKLKKFNEKWHHLNKVKDHLAANFIAPMNGCEVSEAKNRKLLACWDDVVNCQSAIAANINNCSMTDLSKYATALKRLSLHALAMCKMLNIYNDIEECHYNADEKSIFLNGSVLYDLR
jgi:hypothetical protein